MSDETKNDSKASLEKAAMQDADVQSVHAQLMREKDEPEEGFSPVPIALIFIFCALCFWGGVYLIENGGQFRWDVYDPDFKEVRLKKPSPSRWRKSAPRCSVGSVPSVTRPMVRAYPVHSLHWLLPSG